MKKTKKILSLVLAVLMFVSVVPTSVNGANAYTINGKTVRYTDFSSSPDDCWNYANNIYNKIWGQRFNNSFSDSNNSLRNLSDSQLLLNATNLKNYVTHAALGSCLRICNADYLHGTDGWGHSQIIVQKDSNGFTVFEGGLTASPHNREKYYTWSEYCNTNWLGGTYRYIKYIKWPGANAYNSSHSHSYLSHYEADHPHRVYNKCSCGDWYYTGGTQYVSSCSQCNEPTKIVYPTDGGIYKIASGVGNNMYMDYALSNDNVQIYENCDGHSNPDFVKSQYFKLTHVGDGWYTIVNTSNGKAADVQGANSASGTNVIQYEHHKGGSQKFRFYDAGNGYCYIKSSLGTYLDVVNGDNVNNTNVWAYSFNGSNAQKWKLESHSHSYNSKISTQPTCTKTGVKTFTCKCGTSYTESIAKKAHSYNSSITTQPTCTNTGVKTYKCSCGASYTEKINATGHSWIAATCTSKRTCSKCRITDGPALGHNYCIVSFKWDFSKFPYVLTNETCDVCWTSQEENYKMEYSTNLEFDCGTNYVKISWGERFNDQEFYEVDIIDIYQYDKEQGKYVLIKQVDDSLKSYKITGLKPETEYKFCVVAHPGVWSGDNVWIQGSKQVPVEYIAGITAKTKSTHTHTYKTTTTKATLSKNGKVESKCSVCGKVSKTTVYYPKSIKLSKTAYTYNGKVQTPSVTVKDSKGNTLKKDTDYTVKYESGRKAPGKYTVTITFKGKYSGTKKLTFTIVPATVTLSKVTAGSKQATVAWKTVSGVSGYEIQYSTSSKFSSAKTATVGKGSSNKTTIKKLTKGKKYYFKVRAYKTVDGKKIYGAWSSVKSVKIK